MSTEESKILGATKREEVDISRINPTARDAYWYEGPGVGGNKDVKNFLKDLCGVTYNESHTVLDVGFGEGFSLLHAYEAGAKRVVGVDLAQGSLKTLYSDRFGFKDQPEFIRSFAVTTGGRTVEAHWLDVSHEPLPFEDNTFDIVICTETPEHIANLYFAYAEIKRCLKDTGVFLSSFPDCNDNMGYGGGQHMHIYPNFLTPANYRIFMRQLFFKELGFKQNGSSSWFAFQNYKGPGIMDSFHMEAGNFDENELFKCLE